jgi:hypothetical protein
LPADEKENGVISETLGWFWSILTNSRPVIPVAPIIPIFNDILCI